MGNDLREVEIPLSGVCPQANSNSRSIMGNWWDRTSWLAGDDHFGG